jgi:Tat protein translocase TatC
MTAAKAKGEMPFLDHLEELRWRILWSLGAIVAGAVVGYLVVQGFDVVGLLKAPIAPYLPDGKLFITRPTDAFLLTLKLAVLIGLILSAPVVLAQAWAFLAPALYEHEKRYIVPAILAGLGLFVAGVLMAYLWVLPAALRFLLRFQRADLEPIITANEYLGFTVQFLVAFGLVFQLPLVVVLLAALGLVSPNTFARQRPIALIVMAVVAALVTPPDVVSMLMMMVPMVVLYEAGILVGRLVTRRRREPRIGAALLLAAALWPREGVAQEVPRRDTLPPDSVAVPIDTAAARRLGLPSAPSRTLPAVDSVLEALLRLEGYSAIRYAADSITLHGATREVVLSGSALVEREGSILEADSVNFLQAECRLRARGEPALFDEGTVLVGGGMSYDTCAYRGIVSEALTSFVQTGVTWYLRGGIGVDSASTRIYAGSSTITSCDLPVPHYRFASGKVKWVSNTILVARPAVLYVRDVPVLWLPFIFQDMRQGRRSGFLVPRFGLSDLVRPNEGYQRAISNVGYYVALNDYLDVRASFDWLSGNYKQVNGQLRYRWLDRFLSGGVAVSRIFEDGTEEAPGARSMRLQWQHGQSFNQSTSFSASVDYATSARVVQRNTVDPLVQTANLDSRVNFSKRFGWGSLNVGGSRSQDLSNGGVSQTLPTITLTPSPINLSGSLTWSPAFTFTNRQTLDQTPGVIFPLAPIDGVERADTLFPDTRNTDITFATPLRIGRFNWTNNITFMDFRTTRPPAPITLPDPDSPGDSVTRFYAEDFSTALDWNTSFNLPTLFPGTWKIQPSMGIRNTTSGPFLLRNRFTNGEFVTQGKRLSFGGSVTPTLFGFFPGFGPIERIRHSFSPVISWSYAPSATVPQAYARAIDPEGRRSLESPTVHTVSASLFQTFEAKLRPRPGDTTEARQPRKLKLLTIQTSAIAFDFVQAKQPGRTGWTTQAITNRFTSDLLPGFTISTTHDLWDGQVGSDTSDFDPFLTSVSARFSLTGRTLAGIVGLLTGRDEPQRGPELAAEGIPGPEEFIQPPGTGLGPRPGQESGGLGGQPPGKAGFRAAVSYDERRTRPPDDPTAPRPSGDNRTVGFNIAFAPTENWSVSWTTQYNITDGEFGQHQLRLDRDLHRWRATFAFVQAPNGNVAFNFFITLLDQPEIKFQYDQRSTQR